MDLSTTSYAMLGLLALRPWTTYELAQQVQRSLRGLWPVAERQLYEVPKALVARGLATATKERTGERPRTVYRITAAGRRELASWLAEPGGAEIALRSEALLRTFFAEQADDPKVVLLARIDELRAWSAARAAAEVELHEATRAEGYRFPERRHVSALVAALGLAVTAAVERWAEWAADVVDGWPDDLAVPDDADDLLAAVYALPTAPVRS